MLTCTLLTLVLEEDGTVVDSEDFFQSLPNNTPLMVLENGERWTPNKVSIKSRENAVSVSHYCSGEDLLIRIDPGSKNLLVPSFEFLTLQNCCWWLF